MIGSSTSTTTAATPLGVGVDGAVERVTGQAERIVSACREPGTARAGLTAALGDVVQIESWLAARRAELVRKLDEIPGSFPEADIAEITGCTLNAAGKETDRASTLERSVAFADALDAGEIRAGHVDALTRATRNAGADGAATLLDEEEDLVRVAASASIREFERHLQRRARDLVDDADAEATLERQRRNTRLRTWTDHNDGMWCVSGRFDPLTGQALHRAIESTVSTLYSESTPATAPADPLERQQHLAALALVRLVEPGADEVGGAGESGRRSTGSGGGAQGEPIVVLDATSAVSMASGQVPSPIADWGIPIELPRSVLRDVFDAADPDVVIVANGVIIYAPGRLDLGRSSRVANRAQRRALRGLYSTCAVPGCNVHYDRCRLHHVIWWRHGGRTDLDNLLPICQHHHSRLHADQWQLSLGPNRELTVTLPDGNTMHTGPPKRSAA